MGQNNIYNNNSMLTNNNMGQALGQNLGQRDKLKQQALSKLNNSEQPVCPTFVPSPGTAETPANSGSSRFCPTVPLVPQNQRGTKRKHIAPELVRAWKTARPWILDHLQELQAKGWTRKQLFQAGRYSFPHGLWGPAWSPNWLRPGVEVSIDSDGALRWTWTDAVGRQVSQAAGQGYNPGVNRTHFGQKPDKEDKKWKSSCTILH